MWENVFWITIPNCSQLELIMNLSRSDDSQFKQLPREIFKRTAGINFLSFHSISTVYSHNFTLSPSHSNIRVCNALLPLLITS